ncbi:putative periplasmic or secreted lipoprotein (plasmid) [Synechococcus sp. PCC 7502]|uniref:BON domain-containing protein n=1 Tax=Synechococcus sp. PCC 7502 TaxID=1173263 RepID=UPI00029FF51A|nr:BON domain-containing protein [Synechococcus sp. PCC 7502]AFY75475.1 putative periplasmic or secreted lipoprotein [Synechococcus sp. PCC 7502]
MNRKIVTPFVVGILMIATSACNDAKTTSQAPEPNSTNNSNSAPIAQNSQDSKVAKDDAQSEVRQKQLAADIRAREQRNNVAGDQLKRDDSDLASEVRSKLEANIPGGNLTVAAKDAIVTVSGTVPKPDQIPKIQKLGMEIKGVKSMAVTVKLAPQSNLSIPNKYS